MSVWKNAVGSGRRRTTTLVVAGLIGTAALALGTSGALSGFSASIQNTTDTITSGTLTMQEDQLTAVGGTVVSGKTCTSVPGSTTSCSSINKYGGAAAAKPGATSTTVVRITNTGSTSATAFTLTPAACTSTPGTGATTTPDASFCGKVRVTIEDDSTSTPTCLVGVAASNGTCVSGGDTDGLSLSAFYSADGTTGLNLNGPVAGGTARTYTFTAWIAVGGTTNDDQGITASQPLTWTFNGNG